MDRSPGNETGADTAKTRLHLGDRIAILYPLKRFVYGYAKAFAEAGLEVEVPSKRGRQGGNIFPWTSPVTAQN